MKSVEDTLLGRRSIRRYERQPVEREKLDLIYAAIRNTPTSYNGQRSRIIAVTDQTSRRNCTKSPAKSRSRPRPFCWFSASTITSSAWRPAAKGMRTPPFESTIDGYTVGVIDASMAMMSAVTAAESLGLGCCCVGYVRTADPRRISDMLGLPEGVSIVCGLTIGYPREMPDLKPKLPVEAVVHEGRYMPDEKLAPLLETYDRQVAEFNRSRTGDRTDNDWAGHIADYHRHSMEHGIGEYLEKQIGLEK